MQQPGTDLSYSTVPGAPRSDKTFFGLHLDLAGNYCENPKVPGAQLNVNPGRANNMVCKRNYLLYIFQ